MNKQTIVRIEKPAAFLERFIDQFGSSDGLVSFGECVANESLIFAANGEATLGVKRQTDPRTIVRPCGD